MKTFTHRKPLRDLSEVELVNRVAVILGVSPTTVFVEDCTPWRATGFYVDEVGAHREWMVSYEQFYSLPVFPQNRSEWLSDAGWRGQFDTMRRRTAWRPWLMMVGALLLVIALVWVIL